MARCLGSRTWPIVRNNVATAERVVKSSSTMANATVVAENMHMALHRPLAALDIRKEDIHLQNAKALATTQLKVGSRLNTMRLAKPSTTSCEHRTQS